MATNVTVDTVQNAFEDFEKQAVRVPPAQIQAAKQVHPEVRNAVAEALAERLERSFLSGSYARRVHAVRIKDVDIILVLNDPTGEFAASASFTLELIARAAMSCDLVVGRPEASVRAVKCDIAGHEFTVDLVPGLPDPDGELLLARHMPDKGHDDWTPARPQGQVDAATKKNKSTDGIYVPGVRIVKFWNQSFGEDDLKPMHSYLAEAILFHAIDDQVGYAEAVTAFFEAAAQHLATTTPTVTCPGDPENYVDELLEDDRRRRALAEVEKALPIAQAALAEPDPKEACNLWAQIFGDGFPAPDNQPSKLTKRLRNRTGVGPAAGVAAGTSAGREVIPARSWRRS